MKRLKATIYDFNDTLRDKDSGKTNKKLLKKAVKDEKSDHVIVLSGEEPSKKPATRKWLDNHGLKDADLDVRPAHDREPDSQEKSRILTQQILPKYDVDKAYDDKKKNRKVFKKHGIKTKRV